MSHGLLLRLFLSPSFFSVHVALKYLRQYADNIGITYYLTRRLRELDTEELRDVWGFICHLLVTSPSKSRALECFVVDISQRSTHIAMITLWFMQASLKDLDSTRHDSQSFRTCQRMLHCCHQIIFSDLLARSAPYGNLPLTYKPRITRKKIRHHVRPALVGLGVTLAGVPGMPRLTEIMGEVAIEQGREEEDDRGYKSIETEDEEALGGPAFRKTDEHLDEDDDDHEEISPEEIAANRMSEPSTTQLISGSKDHTKVTERVLTRRQTIGPSQTVPALPLHLLTHRNTRLSEDPLGQLDAETTVSAALQYQSSPSIPSPQISQSNLKSADTLLQSYDLESQSSLLRSHYCRSEVQFLLLLESISNRLLVIPRPARVSALRAELTGLNHKLPAEVCLPMWCGSSDTPRSTHGGTQPHHRIVRIPPGESVVLNSAERAPYLLLVEILHDDLDFDPSKRSNKEMLKKIVIQERERKGTSRDLIPFTSSTIFSPKRSQTEHSDVSGKDNSGDLAVSILPPTPSTSSLLLDEDEVDLVEQLYGNGRNVRSATADLSDSIVLPPAPKNKELDIAAWSRPASAPPSPALEPGSRNTRNSFPTLNSAVFSQLSPPTQPEGNGLFLSLDDYSERMRTAAIMLAQLNANLVREPVTAIPEQNSSGGTSLVTENPPTPIPAAHSRMRLQFSEAAAIRDRIMKEMITLEEKRMERMRESPGSDNVSIRDFGVGVNTAEDESIIRRELTKADPSAVVFSESWANKKSRIQHSSPYGHLANWDCVSVIVKTGGDLRQEQLAVQLIQEFEKIWKEENTFCWVRYFRILITGGSSGLVETITDAVSIHSIKKAEYARRLTGGRLGHVTIFDHFKTTYGDPSSVKFARAQQNFAKSLAGYSIVTYLLQIKDRHNGNILLDREGHLIHIDFGFMLSNSPGNIGFEAAPFKLPPEYIEVLGGVNGEMFQEFKRLFREGFAAARKHCDRIITLVELMQTNSSLPCFASFGENTANQLRDRFQPALTHSLVGEYVDRLIDSSLGSNWTRLYDSYQYYSQSIL